MSLYDFFNPTSIAVIGVSHDPKKVGYLTAKNLVNQGYKGKMFFVNPKGGQILGKHIYSSIDEIEDKIDLAVLSVNASVSVSYLDLLHRKGVKHVIFFASGFREMGEDGKKLEQELISTAKKYKITILGPNCIGFINTSKHINTTFLRGAAPKGNIGIISQSGALGSVLIDHFKAGNNIGISHFISIGNKSLINESDVLDFLVHDQSTSVIGLYLEDIVDGKRFRELLEAYSEQKPIIVLKSGRTEAGSQAALSHTGSMAGDDDLFETMVMQSGAIRAKTYSQFVQLLELYSRNQIPEGNNFLILSNAGGFAVMLSDQIVESGLSLDTISHETLMTLSQSFEGKNISIHNPIDLLGDASAFDYLKAIHIAREEKDVQGVFVLLTPQANTEILKTAKVIVQAQNSVDIPIYPVFMGRDALVDATKYFEHHKMPFFTDFDVLLESLSFVHRRNRTLDARYHFNPPLVFSTSLEETIGKTFVRFTKKTNVIPVKESLEICQQIGIETIPLEHVTNQKQLQSYQYPFVLKISSPEINHKTEQQAVSVVHSSQQARDEYKRLCAVVPKHVYAQKAAKGIELFIGAKRDEQFGIFVFVGIGGIYAELFKSVNQLLYPFTIDQFYEVLESTPTITLRNGFRTIPPIDFDHIYDVLMKLGSFMDHFDSIAEADINPIFVYGNEVKAVDARFVVF